MLGQVRDDIWDVTTSSYLSTKYGHKRGSLCIIVGDFLTTEDGDILTTESGETITI